MENQILNGLYGWDVQDYVFKKSNQVITMEQKVKVSIGGENIGIDPQLGGEKIGIDAQLLFQRLVTAGIQQRWAERGVPVRAVQLSLGPVWVATCYVRGR